jgi:chromosomal replication initiator protein
VTAVGSSDTLPALWDHLLTVADAATRSHLAVSKPLELTESTLLIATPNDFTRSRIEVKLRDKLEEIVSDYLDNDIRVTAVVDESLALDSPHAAPPFMPPSPAEPERQTDEEKLNPKYFFDSFVIGPSNRFAHAAAVAVAENPGQSYNPLLIYGASGLGKTHLLHAIGHYIHEYHKRLRVKYASTEEMTNDFINAISSNQTTAFRSMYRDVDVLLLDDIQFLESKIQTQEEFFHTFNALHNAQKQIVITSDRPPKALEALEPRLRSRFEWGLITDIQPADLETRIAILLNKATADDIELGSDVLEFIATNIHTNIRELEGALIRITAFASLNKQPIDLATAEIVLKDLIPESDTPPITAATIMAQTATFFGLTLEELTGSNRSSSFALARQIAMYLCRDHTELSLPKIGALFGRDHTTVLHACNKIRTLIASDAGLYSTLVEITTRVKQATR